MSDRVKFYLQGGVKKERGKPDSVLVREYYEAIRPKLRDNGKTEYVIQAGLVDEDVRRGNAEEYKAFSSYVEANKEALFAQCENLNQPVKFEYKGLSKVASLPVATKEEIEILTDLDLIEEDVENG